MESQVRNYRDLILVMNRELKSLNAILYPILEISLQSDFSHYENIQRELSISTGANSQIIELAREQKKMVAEIQRKANLQLTSKVPGKSITYQDHFTINDQKIRDLRLSYSEAKEALKKIFKKRNKRLVYVKDQLREWQPAIRNLADQRSALEPRLDRLHEITTQELAYSSDVNNVEILAERAQRVDNLMTRLDEIETFFSDLEDIAINENRGYVYLNNIGEPPKKYEKIFKSKLDKYSQLLSELNFILPE